MTSREARKRIATAGYRVERGGYWGTTDDWADRWYLFRPDREVIDRRGSGYETLAAAAADVRILVEIDVCLD